MSAPKGGLVRFLLDTDICSAHMRRPGGLAHRFMQHTGRLSIPTIVLAELYAGAYRHPAPTRLLGLVADLLGEVRVLDFELHVPSSLEKSAELCTGEASR